MRASVQDYWAAFNRPLEGRLPHMYLDNKGFVSTGVGNLIEATGLELSPPTPENRRKSLEIATAIAWRRNDGALADTAEVTAEWDTVKSRMDLASLGGGHFGPPVTNLHITEQEIDRIVVQKLLEMERHLKAQADFANFDSWPADAQLALLSMSWGMGPKFGFPNFRVFARNRDWIGASSECRFKPEIGTIVKRNNLDQQCFVNAARVDAEGLDPEVLLIKDGPTTPPAPEGFMDLATVKGVQEALAALGYDPGPADGVSGPRTTAAVQAFQNNQGLAADGVVGPITRGQLSAALSAMGITSSNGG